MAVGCRLDPSYRLSLGGVIFVNIFPYPTGHLVLHEKKKRREVTGRHDNLAEGVPAAEGWRYVQAADPAAVEALEDTLKRALKPEGSVHGSAAD